MRWTVRSGEQDRSPQAAKRLYHGRMLYSIPVDSVPRRKRFFACSLPLPLPVLCFGVLGPNETSLITVGGRHAGDQSEGRETEQPLHVVGTLYCIVETFLKERSANAKG